MKDYPEFMKQVTEFIPTTTQERQDKRIILDYMNLFSHNILQRDNEFAHITSSGFIMNKTLDKVLMIHHNIRNKWAWTGGHADGDTDLLYVAIKEAIEETGVNDIAPHIKSIASIDILPVYGHTRKGKYISTHLHLSIAYILIANENETLIVKEDENSDVRWFELDKFTEDYFDINDVYLYNKLIQKALKL